MKKILTLLFACTQTLVTFAASEGVVKTLHSNEVWTTPSQNVAESMPLGAGDMGCNVWVENGDLMLYVQRSGAFSEIGEYLKLGRLRISLSNSPFDEYTSFKQEHNLADGNIIVSSEKNGVKTQFVLWVDMFNQSLHITSNSSAAAKMKVAYESWRFADREITDSPQRQELFGCYQFEYTPHKLTKYKDTVTNTESGILFFHRNKEYTESPLLMVATQKLDKYLPQITNVNKLRTSGGILWGEGFAKGSEGEGVYHITPFRSTSIVSTEAKKSHHVCLSTNIEQTATLEEWLTNLKAKKAADAKDKGNKAKNMAWWNAFWERSYIVVDPHQREEDKSFWNMGRNYQLFRYQMGTNLYGEYPTRFNGGNFTYDPSLVAEHRGFDPDWRAWGGDVFTQQNQRLLYWPMLKSGDFDGMAPEFELYMKALPGAQAKVEEFFGHKGAMFTEYLHPSGMDITCTWGWDPNHPTSKGENLRRNLVPFGDPSVNDPATKGIHVWDRIEEGMLGWALSFHWMGQIEHSYMILEKRRYTGEDIVQYMPFIKESMIFFNEHYKLRQRMRDGKDYSADGKLVIYPSTACESYKGAKDPADVLSGLHAVLGSLLAEENKQYLNDEERAYYGEFLKRLPGLPYGEVEGEKIVKAAEFAGREAPDECPQFYPLFPFNHCDIDSEEMNVFRSTWKHGTFWKDQVISWHQDGIFYARMGMVEEASNYNRRKLGNCERRFPSFWGPGNDWVPDHNWGGSGMSGLQEMVLQTIGDKIHILPCWPEGKDVIFKLHAPKNTIVEVEYLDGKVTKCEVTPKSRMKDVKLFL